MNLPDFLFHSSLCIITISQRIRCKVFAVFCPKTLHLYWKKVGEIQVRQGFGSCSGSPIIGYFYFTSNGNILASILDIQNNLESIQNDVELLKQNGFPFPKADVFQRTVDFMTRETTAHRMFIEHQYEMLLQILGFIVIGLGGLIGFLGFKSRKKIETVVDERCPV